MESPDILRKSVRTMEGQALPFATVLTLPATGSEMNSGYVISRRATQEKLSSGGPGLFPQVSVLDRKGYSFYSEKIRLPMVLPMHTLM